MTDNQTGPELKPMPHVQDILAFVAASGEPAVDEALIAALPSADDEARRAIAARLLQRNRLSGQIALVIAFHRLGMRVQEQIVERVDEFSRALRLAIDRSPRGGGRNAIQIIERARAVKLAYLIADQLRHGEPGVCRDAARCLRTLAREAVERPSHRQRPRLEAARKDDLVGAVFDGLRSFGRHRRGELVDAMMLLAPESLADIEPLLSDAHAPLVRLLNERLATPVEPLIRRRLLSFLRFPAVSRSATEGLSQVAADGTFDLLLSDIASLSHPGTRQALRRVAEPAALWPRAAQMEGLPAPALRALVRWAEALPLGLDERVSGLREVARRGDATVRLSVLRGLLRMAGRERDPQVDEAIAEFCRDANESISRTAVWSIIHRGDRGSVKLLSQLTSSPHASIRSLAARHVAPTGFSRFWSQWPDMDTKQRIATGRALMKIDPTFHQKLAEKLLIENRQPRVQALNMIGELGQGRFFEQGLLRLSEDDDVYVASAAARAMASASGEAVAGRLEAMLEHADPRVRANAVESLHQLRRYNHIAKLLQLANESHHRPRTSAIAALMELRTSEALESLGRMLNDDRESHRLSGLWLVEAMGLIEVSRHVAEMAVSDADQAVKQRADRVIGQLMHTLAGAA